MRCLSVLLAVSSLAAVLTAAEKPIPCTLDVSPLRGDSRVTKSGGNMLSRSSSVLSDSGSSKTIERSLKWKVEVRFREQKPAKIELKAYYIGYDSGNEPILVGSEAKAVALDDNGRMAVELTSPKTTLTKTRTRTSSGSSNGFSSTKSRTTGKRVTGGIIQLFGDGKLLKSWASESRWNAVADDVPFSIQALKQKSGKIGLR